MCLDIDHQCAWPLKKQLKATKVLVLTEGWTVCLALVSPCSATKIKLLSLLLTECEGCNLSCLFSVYILFDYSS